MRNRIFLLFVLLLICLWPITNVLETFDTDGSMSIQRSYGQADVNSVNPDVSVSMIGLGGQFTENVGQIQMEDVRYYANGRPLSVGLTPNGVVLDLRTSVETDIDLASIASEDQIRSAVITINFEGCNEVEPRGVGPSDHKSNYFLGNTQDQWVSNVKNYGEVLYENIYDGIDLRFYFKDGMFKYDFIVGKGIDHTIIRLRYDGVTELTTDITTGDLLVHTSAGTVRDMRPVILQDQPEGLDQVFGSFQLLEHETIGFEIPKGISHDRPMVIDPGLLFSTYLGGSENDFGTAIAYDDDGNIYVAGYTDSLDFPTKPSALYPEFIGGNEDVFIAKFDPTFSTLLFATYMGGSDIERPNDIEVLPGDGLCVVGYTLSTDFPIAGNALNDTHLGNEDGFILNLSLDGSVLTYSSYLGGNLEDIATSLDVGDDGSIIIFGHTSSPDLPTTPGAYSQSSAGIRDIFACKLDSSLENIIFCTYLGGALVDEFKGAFVNDDGTSYIVGFTRSDDFPLTSGAYCSTRGGNPDGFVAMLSSTGEELLYSTLLAGDAIVVANSVAVDMNGRVYVTGETDATDFPLTPDAIKTTVTGSKDLFLTVFDGALSELKFSTLVGGNALDYEPRLTYPKGSDTVYLWGRTTSNDLVPTSDAFDPIYRGESDCIIAGFNTTTFKVNYLTYFGGNKDDHPTGLRSDDEGNLYLAGYTRSTDFPTTRGVHCQTFEPGSYLVAYASILAPGPGINPPSAPHGLRAEVDTGSIILYWEPTIADGCRVYKYNIYRGTTPGEEVLMDSVNATTSVFFDDEVLNGIRYYYRLSAESSVGEGPLCGAVSARVLGTPTEALNLTGSTGNGTITLRWEAPLGPGGDQLGYRVLRGETRNDLLVIEPSLKGTVHTVTDPEIGKFRYYAVRTYCEHGEGPLSEALRIKALDSPSQPREFTVTPRDGKVSISWNLPTRDGGTMIIGYHVWKGTDPSNVTILATLSSIQLGHMDSDVVNGRPYFYFVTAFSEVGDGQPTAIVDVIPFGLPGRAESLVATTADSQVTLNWTAPDGNGRPITKYKIYSGESEGSTGLLTTIGNFTGFVHKDLDNGVTYYYKITAVNEAGEGSISTVVSARPMGAPGPATDLAAVSIPSGVRLNWTAPSDLGGSDSVTYRVLRGESETAAEPIAEITDIEEFLDETTELGVTYYYWVQTITSFADGVLTDFVRITAAVVPDIVPNLVTTGGNGIVELSWDPPLADGGSPIVEYVVRRGEFVTGMVEIARVADGTSYTDSEVTNGRTYYYTVRAINRIGAGPQSQAVEGTPIGPPGQPGVFKAEAKGNKVILSWNPPIGQGSAPVTGYQIFRGIGDGDMELLVDLDPVTTYTDEGVEEGKTYKYRVIARSSSGDGQPTEVLDVKIKRSDENPGFGTAVSLFALFIMVAMVLERRRIGTRRSQ